MQNNNEHHIIVLDGDNLTCEQLYQIGYDIKTRIQLSEEAKERVVEARKIVDDIISTDQVKYGINTGFGSFATTVIAKQDIEDLQKNLIRSHSAGVGEYLSLERSKMLLALRINVLAKGFSGIRLDTVEKLVKAFNAGCISAVPCKGSVGASGDLAPLAHMALGMMGEGLMYNPSTKTYEDAAKVLKEHGLEPIQVQAKEGLALINGTQFICALGTEALVRSVNATRVADIVGAMTLEALRGTFKAFDARIHAARRHTGQVKVAGRMRSLLFSEKTVGNEKKFEISEISGSHLNCSRVQDAYTLRCIPQVHGIVNDTVEFCKNIMENELNAATDNPMVFSNKKGSQVPNSHHIHLDDENSRSELHLTTSLENDEQIVSGGNFHGEYPAKAMDFLAIGITELANISERRIARLIDGNLSGLPAFLVKDGGLNSGFMIAHCTASALTSENKVLVHPSSNDTLSTSAAKEDHVSMGPFASLKCLDVVKNVEYVLAIELMCACQGVDLLRPLKTTPILEKVYQLVRSVVPKYEKDRFLSPDIENICQLIKSGKLWETVKDDLETYMH
ncbi:histidine ammonia lyase [Naegleria gruberi]|uniref:Histidine ammonia-lyase n=1 Tax=Naegleria gruberi TaxID=5762 RepID=D2V763_NAEGR|nr:histidine ammonia lyase [Naegleria gruberi]EFC47317.1 histidine ammonia lyase [Naegleria gruberi]|eukprot:XP_002680061.1 histidine ammonia lyase [Naegleria gruberi strain NEG-M]